MSAQIIPFPPIERDCTKCEHVFMGPHGLFCGLWREEIIDSLIAEDCGAYEEY